MFFWFVVLIFGSSAIYLVILYLAMAERKYKEFV